MMESVFAAPAALLWCRPRRETAADWRGLGCALLPSQLEQRMI